MAFKAEELAVDLEITMHVDSSKTYTTAAALLTTVNGDEVAGIGTAKRTRGDRYNEEVGYSLSLARAFRDLADELEANAHAHDGTH